MLAAAESRLAPFGNVELHHGELEALPIADGALDAAVLSLALHLAPEPARVLAEAARVLRAGGKLLIVDMMPHERTDFSESMGHLWPGFDADSIGTWAAPPASPLRRTIPCLPTRRPRARRCSPRCSAAASILRPVDPEA